MVSKKENPLVTRLFAEIERRNSSVPKFAKEVGIKSPDKIYKWRTEFTNPKAVDEKKIHEWLIGDKSEKIPRERFDDLTETIKKIVSWQAGIDGAISVLISEIAPLIAKHTEKSTAAAFSQLKRDIEAETKNRVDELNRKG